MAVNWLSAVERARLVQFPENISETDLIRFFTLTKQDLRFIRKYYGATGRLGVAMQLCSLRFLGFIPEDLHKAPKQVIEFIAGQFGVSAKSLKRYGSRNRTRSVHTREVEKYLGFRPIDSPRWKKIEAWLVEQAMEHDRPMLLLEFLCERLHEMKIVRPGISVLERAIAGARRQAHAETWLKVKPLLGKKDKERLDALLIVEEEYGTTSLTRFRTGAVSHTAEAILKVLDKIVEMRALGADRWDLSALNPNRLKLLARVGKRSTNQALERMSLERRYPILLAFLRQTLTETIDEAIDLFDRHLAEIDSKAGRELDELRKKAAKSTNEKVSLFWTIGRIVLDLKVKDSKVRQTIYKEIEPDKLRTAVDECEKIARPLDDSYFDLLGNRYSNIRQFAPRFLETFSWRSGQDDDPLLQAIRIISELNADHRRSLPADAPTEFIPPEWLPYVIGKDKQLVRRYYEMCLLWQMREALRNSNLWIEGSRRFINPELYLITTEQWPEMRKETCRLMKVSSDGSVRFEQRKEEYRLVAEFLTGKLTDQNQVRIEDERLIVSPLEAEDRAASVVELEDLIVERLPRIDLSTLLIEVDRWVKFSEAFTHAGGSASRKPDLLPFLYADILAESGNFGLTQMERMSGLPYQQLLWTSTWYIRDETLRDAVTRLVNYHFKLPLSNIFGDGTLSSSDGQRFPVAVKAANAVALPKYYGFGKGLTFYTWTSNQHSQYGTKPVISTKRDATVILDEVLDNETELPLFAHAADTAGYTEIIFALFDLLGYQFVPRLRDIGAQTLYRVGGVDIPSQVRKLMKKKLRPEYFLSRWDDLLRLAGSLKRGWVTASLLVGKLHAMPKANALVAALQEYGRLIKTNFILQYLGNEDFRRRINRQLNKGESLHSLRRYLFVANEAHIRKRHYETQLNQAGCLNLMTNAVVVWNTVYMWEAIEQLRREGREISDDDIRHLSPARYEHINVFGKYFFPVEEEMKRKGLRPLRNVQDSE
jgi:TnpA family transposase